MKKIFIQALFLAMLTVTVVSCKKNIDKEPEPDPQPELPSNLQLVDATVVLPAGSSYSLAGHEIFHQSKSLSVASDGKAKVVKPSGKISIAYLLNKDGKVAMAGFITDSTTTISTETTAKVLLYFAMGTHMGEDTLTPIFINQIDKVPGIKDWMNDFTTAWKADPLTFNTGTYREKLRTWIKAKDSESTPAGAKVGSVQANANDVRSGLRISPAGLGLSFTNNYRRRVKATFYKMKHKLTGNTNYSPILSSIDKSTDYDRLEEIDAASGVTSFTGEIWKHTTERGTQSFAMTTGPLYLNLDDNETEAVYKIRAIGPGKIDPAKLTTKEEYEYLKLISYSLFMDVVMPTVACASSTVKEAIIDPTLADQIILVDLPKILPGFIESFYRGEYTKAILGVVDALASDHGFEIMMKIIKAQLPAGMEEPRLDQIAEKGIAILKGVDMAMQIGDFIRIGAEWAVSQGLEEWDITIRAGKVKVSPDEAVVSISSPSNKQDLEATIQNLSADDMAKIEYQWTVAGKFGTIADSKGNTGTTFKTKDKKVSFTAKNDPSLTNGDNWERVIVKAMLDNEEIGVDTARINVKKSRYQLLPDGVTISGKQGQTNSVRLRIAPVGANGVAIPNSDNDYKIIWETSGAYGTLRVSETRTKFITTYNYSKIEYECTNSVIKSATETVSALIYSKKKGSPDNEYTLTDNIKATIKISNDDKKIIRHIPVTCSHGDTLRDNGNSITCMIATYAMVNAEPEAKSYSIRFYDVLYPISRSWDAGSPTLKNMFVANYVMPATATSWPIELDASWSVGATSLVKHLNCSPPGMGMAELIITLK